MSKRFLVVQYGFNMRRVETLLRTGVLKPLGCGIARDSISALVEGVHYVVCKECGAYQSALTDKHLKTCSGITSAEYAIRYPAGLLSSTVTDDRRAKTPEQRQRQSDTLKRRFQTTVGIATKEQIAEASKQLMQTEYRERAARHLQEYNQAHRSEISERSKRMWQDPAFRAKVKQSVEKRRELLAESAAHARGFITRTFSKPHQILETALKQAGVKGLEREHRIGPYRVDEALPDRKIAIEVDGCYWHGCQECGFPGHPYTVKLDKRKTAYLSGKGWQILRIPEHSLAKDLANTVQGILEALHG